MSDAVLPIILQNSVLKNESWVDVSSSTHSPKSFKLFPFSRHLVHIPTGRCLHCS